MITFSCDALNVVIKTYIQGVSLFGNRFNSISWLHLTRDFNNRTLHDTQSVQSGFIWWNQLESAIITVNVETQKWRVFKGVIIKWYYQNDDIICFKMGKQQTLLLNLQWSSTQIHQHILTVFLLHKFSISLFYAWF